MKVPKIKEIRKENYRIILDKKNPEKWTVELLSGDWKGIIYSYGEFSFIQPEAGDSETPCTCKFETDIIFVPDRFKGVQFNAEQELDFHTTLGKILMEIIEENSSDMKKKNNQFVLSLK